MRKVLKFILWCFVSLLCLIILAVILIQTTFVQNYLKDKALAYVHGKISTPLTIRQFYFDFSGNIHINGIYIEDQRKDTLLYADSISVKLSIPDLLRGKYHVRNIALTNMVAHIKRTQGDTVFNYQYIVNAFAPPDTTKDTTTTGNISLQADHILLKKIALVYADDMTATAFNMSIGELATDIHADITNLIFDTKKLALNDTHIGIRMGKAKAKVQQDTTNTTTDTAATHWAYNAATVQLGNNSFYYDDDNQQPVQNAIDYSHLHIDRLNINGRSLALSDTQYSGNITAASLQEKSGIAIQNLEAEFLYNDQQTVIKNCVLKTNHSAIYAKALLQYQSVSDFGNNKLGNIKVDAAFDSTSVSVNELLTVAPMLSAYLKKYQNSNIKLQGMAKGTVNDLLIPNFAVSGLGYNSVVLSGKIKGLPDVNKTVYQLNVQQLTTSAADIKNFIADTLLPSSIRLPDKIAMKGAFSGDMKTFSTNWRINTSQGNATIVASMRNQKSYKAKLMLDNLDVGYLAKQEKNIGRISLTTDITGTGTDYKTMTATIHANVSKALIQNYPYTNFALNATLAKGMLEAEASMNDDNLQFDLSAAANIANTYPSDLTLQLHVDTCNLYALHFTKDTLALKGDIVADFTDVHPDSLQGALTISNLSIAMDTTYYTTDSIILTAKREEGKENIVLQSEAVSASLKGEYKLTELSTAMMHCISQYYPVPGFKDTAFTPQQWQMNLSAHASPLVLRFLPALTLTDTIRGKINFNSSENMLDANIIAPRIIYSGQAFNSLRFYAKTNADKLDYALKLDKSTGKQIKLYRTALTGSLANKQLTSTLQSFDKKDRLQYMLAAELQQTATGLKVKLLPDSLRLNYDKWNVPADNYITYDSAGICINNLALSRQDELLKINSMPTQANAPIEVTFNKFRIKTLTYFMGQDTLLMDGIVNGKAVVKDVMKKPLFTSDISISDVMYRKDSIGNITAKVSNDAADTYNALIKISGNDNDVQLSGQYFSNESNMKMALDIKRLNLGIIQPFAEDYIQDIGGQMHGKIDISGSASKPSLNGGIQFADAFITTKMLGERFTLPHDTVSIDNAGLHFNRFTLRDSANNPTVINGDILTTDFTSYAFKLDIRARNFTVVNATQAENHAFYGKLNISATIAVTGDMQTPKINARIKANPITNFVFVLPSSDPEVEDREGVVHFINISQKDSIQERADSLARKIPVMKNLDLSLTLETDTSAQFTLIIDERNGDALRIKGKANIVTEMDESGKMSFTGNYEVARGSYQVTVGVLKKRFDVLSGSSILWTGDPMAAQINITAAYSLRTAPIDLVQSQIAGRSGSDVDKFKQKLPFSVLLKMKGDLMKPEITFDITLAKEETANWPDVETRLGQLRNDASEMNKQVFALLLLNRFVQENPLESGAGSSATAIAKESVSRLLTEQVNQLAGDLIKGVDVNFGLNTEDDYSSGERQSRTDLNVNVSKTILNDRLKVTVGSDFAMEGSTSTSQSTSNIAGDVSMQYKLSKDGRYSLRAYRVNKYEGAVEGQVVESGLTFALTFEYDKLKELFQREKKKRK